MQFSAKVLTIPIAMALMGTIPAKANLITNGSFEAASINPLASPTAFSKRTVHILANGC